MKSGTLLAILLLATRALVAAQPQAPKGTEKGATALSPAQHKVAHYLSEDGTLGFVLDRSGTPAKVRFDGEKAVIELTLEEEVRGGERRGLLYKRPDGRNVIHINSLTGAMKAFTPTSSVSVRYDRSAAPLPKVTVKGQYNAPKTMYEMAIEEFTPRSVMARFPRFRPEDSGNLQEVAKAIKLIDASMLVRINGTGAANAQWAPASQKIGDVTQGLGGGVSPWPLRNRKWDRSATGLARYGAVLMDDRPEFSHPSRLKLMALDGWPAPLAPDTPGFIWGVYDGMLIFVTLDGGRYQISLSGTDENSGYPLTLGLAPEACWPAPLQHSLVDVETIRALAKGEAIPEKVGEQIEAIDDGWFHCVNGVWQATRAELEKAAGVKKLASQHALKDCDGEKAKLEAALVAFIEARDAERMALFEKARTRVRSLVPPPQKH